LSEIPMTESPDYGFNYYGFQFVQIQLLRVSVTV
jgi:hypothetical protein